MPELPEVESVRRVLDAAVTGCRIERTELRRPEIITRPDAGTFIRDTENHVIERAARRGQYLILVLDSGKIVTHLRMTGCLLPAPPDYPEEKHTHLVFHLSDGSELRFSDQRRFGRVFLINDGEKCAELEKLGPEPSDPSFSASYLHSSVSRSRRAIKECLMDQSVIAGIGNIYADEILFDAGINPARMACTVTEEECRRLAETIPRLISFFTEKNAMTATEYLELRGKDYRNTPYLRVYGRSGETCPRCGCILQRTVIGGRSSTYCPVCQKEMRC